MRNRTDQYIAVYDWLLRQDHGVPAIEIARRVGSHGGPDGALLPFEALGLPLTEDDDGLIYAYRIEGEETK